MSQTITTSTGLSGTGSTGLWNNLSVRQSVSYAANPLFLRTMQLNGNMLVVSRGSNICGILLSDLIALAIAQVPALSYPPNITSQPVDVTVTHPAGTSFSVTAVSELPSQTYQWQLNTGSGFSNITNGGVYSGATTATLSLSSTTVSGPNMNGYIYRCVVTNAAGSTNSNSATLTVN
jgi:hypothetical protein